MPPSVTFDASRCRNQLYTEMVLYFRGRILRYHTAVTHNRMMFTSATLAKSWVLWRAHAINVWCKREIQGLTAHFA